MTSFIDVYKNNLSSLIDSISQDTEYFIFNKEQFTTFEIEKNIEDGKKLFKKFWNYRFFKSLESYVLNFTYVLHKYLIALQGELMERKNDKRSLCL